MKNISLSIFKLLFIFTLAFSINSCQKLSIDTQPDAVAKFEIDAMAEYSVVAASPSAITFNVSSNRAWKIVSDAQWCEVTPSMSSMSSLIAEVTVTCGDNGELISREANLTFEVEGIEEDFSIKIMQEEKSSFTIQPIDEMIDSSGGEYSFTVASNREWSVRSDKQWVSFDKTQGEGSGQAAIVMVNFTPNTGALRSAMIILSNGMEEKSFSVQQQGFVLNFEELGSELDATLPANGGSKIFNIEANVEWEATCEDPTATLEKVSATELKVTLIGNNIFGKKSYTVKLKPTAPSLVGLVEGEMELFQPMNLYFDGVTENLTYNSDGSVTLTTANAKMARMVTNSEQGMGTFVWKFENVNVEGNGYFDLNAYPNSGNLNYHVYAGGDDNYVSSGGSGTSTVTGESFGIWSEPLALSITPELLNSMTELKVVVEPNPEDETKLVFEVFINSESVGRDENRVNMWYHIPTHSMPFYFGFVGGLTGTSSMTIKSFDVTPYKK